MKDHYFVPQKDDSPYNVMGHFVKCDKCQRKIVVDIVLCGSNHNASVSVMCGDCVDLKIVEENCPELVEDFREFLKN